MVPSAMFYAVRIPVTPSVNRREPTTSGVELGPLAICVAYWFFLNSDWYFCCHTTFPLARSIAVTISSGSRRLCTNARPLAATGDEYPSPISTDHPRLTAAGHCFGITAAGMTPSRAGPRHWLQSWANATDALDKTAQTNSTRTRAC